MFGLDFALLGESRLGRALAALSAMLLLLALLILALNSHDQAQRQTGAVAAQADQLGQSIIHVEQANEVRSQIRDPGSSARFDQCLRSARHRENCQRYVPQ